jgi:hypothetical protein
MKNIKGRTAILVLSLAVVVIGSFAFSSAMAYQGNYSESGPNCSPDRHEAMMQAMDNNDYQAWNELMAGRGRVSQVVKADNFARFAEAHRLAQAGDVEGADTIRQELGLRTSDGERMGAGYRGGQGEMEGIGRGQSQNRNSTGNSNS